MTAENHGYGKDINYKENSTKLCISKEHCKPKKEKKKNSETIT